MIDAAVRLWLILFASAWLAGTISGVVGFGGALLFLPILSQAVGAKAAVPILTVAQLLGNLSRAGFGWKSIAWRPAALFCAGAIPACIVGARVYIAIPAGAFPRLIGILLLGFIGLGHTPLSRAFPRGRLMLLAGVLVGFLSGVAGSVGPLGAAAFLGLGLAPGAYVATEAVPAALIHMTKIGVYGSYAAITPEGLADGLAIGGAMILGSWTGRKLIDRVPAHRFRTLVEVLMLAAAISLIVRPA